MANTQEKQQQGLNLATLGLKSPMEVIDILGLLRISGDPVIKDEKAILDPEMKARAVVEYFHRRFNVAPDHLPFLASVIKKRIKSRVRGQK